MNIFKSIHGLPSNRPMVATPIKTMVSKNGTSLTFSGKFSDSKGTGRYKVTIATPLKSAVKKNTITSACISVTKDSKPLAAKLPTTASKFRVRCTCPDYTYTYSSVNHATGYHFGKLAPIPPVKGTGAPRNPDKTPGSCKHIISFYTTLRRRGIILPAT